MNPEIKAEQDLRIIRNLMERATIYRAISAPTALFGGSLSILAAFFGSDLDAHQFIASWLFVLLATLVVNTWFIWQKARRESGKIFSPGLRLAIRSALPVLVLTTAFTASLWLNDGGQAVSLLTATVWTLLYGLALLSTATFAPRSLIVLGWIFFLTGLAARPTAYAISGLSIKDMPALLMGLTFGVYHLVYAVCVWPRKRAADAAAQLSIE